MIHERTIFSVGGVDFDNRQDAQRYDEQRGLAARIFNEMDCVLRIEDADAIASWIFSNYSLGEVDE